MKIIGTFFCIIFLTQCSQNQKDGVFMGEFKLKDGRIIELVHSNGGATTAMRINVKVKDSNLTIDQLQGFSYTYLVSFNQVNDTLLRLTLTDTAFFKGKKIERLVNLNNRITDYK